MKIWFNKNFSSIDFILQELQKNNQVITLFSHTHAVEHQKYADYFIYEPEITDNYVSFCLETCQHHKIDVFYPWRNFSKLYPFKNKFSELGVNIIFPCSDINFHIIDNKAAFYRHLLAQKTEVTIPLFSTATNSDEFIKQYNLLKMQTDKLCMKPSVSIYAAGFKIIHDEPNYNAWETLLYGKDKYAIAYSQLIQLLPKKFHKEIMLLDFLSGDEYSHDILCREGEIIAGTIRKKYQESDKYQFLIQNFEIDRMSQLLVTEFQLSGFINIQYRDDKHGVPHLLEINPRISGGFSKISFGGINYVNLFIKMLTHQQITTQDTQQAYNLKVIGKTCYSLAV